MASWNDASFADVDWTAKTFLDMFRLAAQERQDVGGGGGAVPVEATAGTDVQRYLFILSHQTFAEETYFTFVPVGATTPDAYPDLASVFAAAGLDPAIGFERRQPREVATTASTTDMRGNTATTGQRAWLLASPFGLVEYDGAAWVQTTHLNGPDVLSNYSAAPDTIPATTTPAVGVDEDNGYHREGDYIGAWIFEQARDVYNVLLHTQESASWIGPGGGHREATGSPSGSYATAKASASAAFTADTVNPGNFAPRKYTRASFSGGSYEVYKSATIGSLRTSSIPVGYTRDVDFYLLPEPSEPGGTFDANGAPIANGAWYKFDTQAGTTSDPVDSATFDNTNEPNDAPDPTASGTEYQGYTVVAGAAVVKWDVVGGFTYKP